MFGLTPFNHRKTNDLARQNDIFDMRSIFENFFNDSMFPAFPSFGASMRADIRETEKEYVIDAEIPGVNKEDIKLDLRDDVLTISVEHNEQINEERDNYVRKERRFGSFSRSFYVDNVKHDGVTAKYDNGILTVKLPKDETGNNRRYQIDIQ
ncbi:MAG: Hsp20/alpha crystallin family protein [Clostridia bacterium]|nr:Hsp20/alpha crystallin family protein [Clostridia bacterium]